MAEGLDLREPPALCTCEACLEGRMTRAPHKGHIEPGRYLDELIYIDIVRPLKLAKDDRFYGSRVGIRGSEISGGAH